MPPATRPQRTCAPSVSRQIGTEQSSRTRLIVGSTASSGVWDRLRRNRSTPRPASPPITSSFSDAGPNVQSTCSFTSRFPPVVDGCASPMGQTAAIGRTRCRWFYATRACRSARICMSLPTVDARLPGAVRCGNNRWLTRHLEARPCCSSSSEPAAVARRWWPSSSPAIPTSVSSPTSTTSWPGSTCPAAGTVPCSAGRRRGPRIWCPSVTGAGRSSGAVSGSLPPRAGRCWSGRSRRSSPPPTGTWSPPT